MFHRRVTFVLLLFAPMLLSGCWHTTTQSQPSLAPTITRTPIPSTATSPPPTPSFTAEPLAIRVNGTGFSLAEFDAELKRFQDSQIESGGKPIDSQEASKQVVEEIINQILLEQGATRNGFQVTDDLVSSHMEKLQQQLGDEKALVDWQNKYGYTDSSFRASLRRSIAAAWQANKIASEVPTSTEQVHARQILLLDSDSADQVYQQLQAGADFAMLAWKYDTLTGGDLGWFPRRYLTRLEIEEAAFKLQPGQYSPVISTDFGFQIIQVIERDPNRSLAPDALRVLQHLAIQDWLDEQRKESKIEILLPDWKQ